MHTNTVIYPNVLANLTRDMESMKRGAMELLNQGKDRRWVYSVIWVMWFIVIPLLGLYLYKIRVDEIAAPVLILGSPVVYWIMLNVYTQVKVWEKQHRTTWDEVVKKYKRGCILLCVDHRDSPAAQIKKIEDDLASIVDYLLEAQEVVNAKALELRRMIRAGDLPVQIALIKSEILEMENQIHKSSDELKQKMDVAKGLFAGDFGDPDLKYRDLFRAGSERSSGKKVQEETRTRHPFASRV